MANREWGLEERIEVAIAWMITGSIAQASKLTEVPERTIRYWMAQEWWETVLEQARNKKQKELDALWTGIIHAATSELRERIDNGDEVITKDGSIRKVKVKAKDLASITAIAVDKRALARGQATSRTEKVSITDRLSSITEQLHKQSESAIEEVKH